MDERDFEQEDLSTEDLKQAAVAGVRWTTAARLGIEVVTLASAVVLARLIAPAGSIAQEGQQRQCDPGREREVELGGQCPKAEIAAGSFHSSAAPDDIGEKRWRQREVGAQRNARQDANDRKCGGVARTQPRSPDKGGDGDEHEEDQRHRILARHDRDFDPVRDSPEFQDLLAS